MLPALASMVDQVLLHDLLSEALYLWISRIDNGPHPMRVRVAKGRYPCEVFNGSAAGRAAQGFVDAKGDSPAGKPFAAWLLFRVWRPP